MIPAIMGPSLTASQVSQNIQRTALYRPRAPFSYRCGWNVPKRAARAWAGGEPKGSFGDELLDFMYAGKKLRKWYGEEGMVLPKDGGPQPEGEEPEEDNAPVERDQILVLDADSPTGEQVVLQLILARASIKALVKDASAATASFGPYIQAVQGSQADARALKVALRGVRAAVATGRLGGLLPAARAAGVEHLVLLSSVGAPRRGLGALLGGGEQGVLGDAERQAAALGSGVACTVVQVGGLLDEPGGNEDIAVSSGAAPQGEISREDAARVLARVAVGAAPAPGAPPVVLQVRLSPGRAADWEADLDALLQRPAATAAPPA